MQFNSKNWLSWAILLLLIINLISLGKSWLPDERKKPPVRQGSLEADLNMTDQQINRFSELREMHFKETRPIVAQLRKKRSELVEKGLLEEGSEGREALMNEIGALQQAIDDKVFSHFGKLREVLDQDQQKQFDKMLPRLLGQGRPPANNSGPGKGGPPGRGGPDRQGAGPDSPRPGGPGGPGHDGPRHDGPDGF